MTIWINLRWRQKLFFAKITNNLKPKPLDIARDTSLKKAPLVKIIDKPKPKLKSFSNENPKEFREIEFKYPTWKPGLNLSSENINNEKRDAYHDFINESQSNLKSIKIDA